MTHEQPSTQDRSRLPRRAIRIVALAATGAVAMAVGTANVATAGAPPAAAYHQRPAWHRCDPDAPANFECATITVPLDYRHPAGRSLGIAISRIRTSVPGKHRGILLANPGGPGGSGTYLPMMLQETLPAAVREQYDLVGFDPRGVGGSSPITCGLSEDERSNPLSPYKPQTFAADIARARSVAGKCATFADTLAFVTTRNTARDMDLIRAVLGEPKLSYLGYSYGTYLGAVYAQLFGARADRLVLDSSVDPKLAWRGALQSWAVGSNPAFERFTRWTAQRPQYGLGGTPQAVAKTFWDLVARADRTPIPTGGGSVTGDDIRLGARAEVFFPQVAAEEIAELKKAADGTRLAASRFAAAPEPPDDNSMAVFWTIVCNDVTNWPRNVEQYRRDAIRDKRRYPLAGDVMSNVMPCAFWTVPHIENGAAVTNGVHALVVQNEWDPQTPSFMGLGMHRALTGSRLVFVRDGEGHGVYGGGNTCADGAVNDYLATGLLPKADVTCQAQPQARKSLIARMPQRRLPGPF